MSQTPMMVEPTDPHPPRRAALAGRSLLQAPPPESPLDVVRFHRGRAKAYRRVSEAVRAGRERGAAWALASCNDPAHRERAAALEAAGLEGLDDQLMELDALARLAEATASAVLHGHLEEALRLADLQSSLLSAHSLLCLAELAGCMADDPSARDLLATLAELLAADRRLLVGHDESPP